MQSKTIKKAIQSKLEQWLDTVTDQSLRDDLKNSVLVSGGCITSMYLDLPVSDYDVYIMDRSVLLRLVNYYTEPFKVTKGITVLDGTKKEQIIKDLLSHYPSDDTIDTIISAHSSAIRTLKEDQIKLYFEDKNGGIKVNEPKKGEEQKPLQYIPKFFSPNAISLSDDLQIVIRFWGDAEKIHSTFDFVHATNYFTFKEGLVTNKAALESILTKQLRYQGSHYPVTTIIRTKKFLKRGWNINAGELLKVMFQISELDLSNPDVLEEQLIGVYVAYFGQLIEIMRERTDAGKKDSLSPAYIMELIDRVFNDGENEDKI